MRRKNTYKEVRQLPPGSLAVKEYAAKKGVSTQSLYNAIRKGKAIGFEIVIFQGYNFVIEQ